VETFQSGDAPVLSLDNTVSIRPGDGAEDSVQAVSPYACRAVTAEAEITKAGGAYALRLNWKFEAPEPELWAIEMYADQNDGRKDNLVFYSMAFVRRGEALSYVSQPMERNRHYRFLLIGRVKQPSGPQNIEGDVIYKTISADLRGVP